MLFVPKMPSLSEASEVDGLPGFHVGMDVNFPKAIRNAAVTLHAEPGHSHVGWKDILPTSWCKSGVSEGAAVATRTRVMVQTDGQGSTPTGDLIHAMELHSQPVSEMGYQLCMALQLLHDQTCATAEMVLYATEVAYQISWSEKRSFIAPRPTLVAHRLIAR